MSEPLFLSVAQVERFHEQSIRVFGGTLGLRAPDLLESAVMNARNVYFYSHGDFFDVAAAYAYHIAENQPFLDGNKRAAMTAALAFLATNGVTKDFDWHILYEAMIAIAAKRMTREQLAAVLRAAPAGS